MSSTIPQNVNRSAAAILAGQSDVPLSPAEKDADGRINLCLAGAIAKAGLELFVSGERASAFADELERTRSKEVIERAFVQLGWDVGTCRARIALNDRTEHSVRKAELVNYLLNH